MPVVPDPVVPDPFDPVSVGPVPVPGFRFRLHCIGSEWGTANMSAYLMFQFDDAIAFNRGFDHSSVNAFYRTTVANIIGMPTLEPSACGISKK